jgi:hypothetical protein
MHRGLLVVAIAAACGPSSSELRTARETLYNADPHVILKLAAEAAEGEKYRIAAVDEAQLSFVTVPKFYSSTGDLESAGADNIVKIRPGSVQVELVVRVLATDPHHVGVSVTPKTFQAIAGSPKPRELAPDDPYLPSFVTGRADALSLAIYERAKPYALAPPGGS